MSGCCADREGDWESVEVLFDCVCEMRTGEVSPTGWVLIGGANPAAGAASKDFASSRTEGALDLLVGACISGY